MANRRDFIKSTAAAVIAEIGAHFVPPYDHPDVIAGQGTVALELLAQVPGLQVQLGPVQRAWPLGFVSRCWIAVQPTCPRPNA